MAAIIDGSSVRGHWKITPDNGTPNAYYVIPKGSIVFISSGADTGTIRSEQYVDLNISLDNTTISETGQELNTSAKITTYISENK